jgi:uncharacterized protein YegP (UPF0339 family)
MASTREVYKRSDGKWGFRVKSSSDIVATDGGQGYNNKADAKDILKKLVDGTYDGPITELD